VPVYRRVLAMAPRMTASWINLATCYQLIDSLPEALAAYAEAERVDSTVLIRDNLNQEWGRVFVRMGRLAAAESAFRRMLPQPDRANQARGRRSLGYLAMSRGDYRAAFAEFGEASDAFEAGNNFLPAARSETMAAQAAANLGDEAEARARLAKAAVLLREFRLEPSFHLYLGLAHLRIGDIAGAKVWLTRLNRVVGPGGQADTTIRNLLDARIAIAAGKFTRARVLLPDQVPAAVNYLEPVALETRGRVHWGLSRPDSALAAWRRAQATFTWGTELQDEWERLPLSIANAALATGDSATARAALSEMLERWKGAPNEFPDLRRTRERLKNLQADVSR
jgi:tetratricopeptide (TPR) repeat protein